MEIRLVAYDRLGARRGIVPNPLELNFTPTHNELTVLSIHYDRESANHVYLDNTPEIAVETFINNAWVERRDARLRLLTIDFDHLEEVPTRRYDFIGIGEALKGVLVYSAYNLPLNDEGNPQFELSTPGRILATVWDNAETRGWTGFDYSFTPTADSNGQAWTNTFTISYPVEQNLLAILSALVAQGVVDFSWSGRTLNVYNAHTYLARDLTLGANPIKFAGAGQLGIDAAPEMEDRSNLATHIVVLGENNLRWEFPTGTIIPEGRREIVLSYSGVDDTATAQLLANPVILKAQNFLKNTTRQFHLNDDTKLEPFRDFDTGDWVNVLRGTTYERMRIYSLNIQKNASGIQGYVMLGDKIDDLLSIMYQRIQGLTGGVANEGGPPPVYKGRIPSAPTGVVLSTDAYIDKDGVTQGSINVQWAHNGRDTAGESIIVEMYNVLYRPSGTATWNELFTTNGTIGTGSPVTVYDEVLDPIVYEVKVIAYSAAGIKSPDSAIVAVTMREDITPPPKPTLPTLSTWLRTITIKWDGLGFTTVPVTMPPDLAYINVWEATNSQMTGATVVDRFNDHTFSTIVGPRTAGTTYWYALSAVDRSGNESVKTTAVSIMPVATVDADEIIDRIDAALLTLTNVTGDALVNGAITNTKLADNAVSQAKLQDQIISFGKLDTSVDAKITKGVTDAATAQTAADNANSAAGAAQADADAAQAAADAAIASGQNLVFDGGFEANGWPINSSVAFDTAEKRSGLRSIKLTPSGGNLWPTSLWVNGTTGRTYRLEYWIKRSGTQSVLSGIGAVIQAKNTAGTISTPVATGTPRDTLDISTTGYTKVVIDHTVTYADTVEVRFAPWVKLSTNIYWVDDFTVTDITDAKEALAAAAAAQQKADEAFADAAEAMTAAGNAQTSANGKNNVYYLSALPSGTGFVNGDTVFIRSAVGQPITAQYTWDTPSLTWKLETLSHQVIASVDLGKANVGELDGIYVKAKSLQADKLLISQGANLFTDPLIQDASGWSSYYSASGGKNGGGSIVIPMSSVQGGVYYAYAANLSERRTRLVPGGTYRISGWVKTSAAAPINTLQLYLRYQSPGTITGAIATNVATAIPNNPVATVADTWTFISGMVTIPESTTYTTGVLGVFKQAGYTTGTTTWSDLSIQQAAGGELVVDGSITAGKVAANAVQARHLVVGDFANLALGSDFEDAAAVPWVLASTTATPPQPAAHVISTTQKKFGASSLRLNPVSVSTSPAKSVFLGDMKSVKEGEQWVFKFWAFLDTTFNGLANSKLRISNQSDTVLLEMPFNALTKNVWTLVENFLTIPAGTTSLNVQLWNDQTVAYAYIDDIQIRRMSEASLIQNLGVEKLTASTALMAQATIDKLWADVVRSKKITTDMLVVAGDNMMPNGFAETGDNTNWSLWGFDAADKPSGTLGSFTLNTQVTVNLANNAAVPLVEENTFYLIEGWIKASVTGSRVYLEALEVGGTNPTPVYPLQSYPVPTVWTRFSVPVKTSVGQTGMSFRLFANHSTGTVFNATQKIAGLYYRKMNSAALMVSGGIIADHLAIDSVTASKIKALEVSTPHLAANAVTTDKVNAGAITANKLESQLVLATKIIAGSPTGTHAEMDGSGFRVFSDDPSDGVPNEVVRMGVAATSDFLAITNSAGQLVTTIDEAGKVSSLEVHARDALWYKGRELTELLKDLPQGMTAYGDFYTGITGISTEYGIFDVQALVQPGRAYEVTMYASVISSNGLGGVVHLVRTADGGVAPTLSSTELIRREHDLETDSVPHFSHTFLWYPGVTAPTTKRLLWSMTKFGGGTANWSGGELYIKDVGRQRLTAGTMNNGGGSTATPVQIYTKQWACTGSMNYQGSNAQYNYDTGNMYQGLSPAGYGNLKSLATFGTNSDGETITQALAGAVVNQVIVYFNFQHWYNNAGGTARIGLHSAATIPATFGSTGAVVASGGWPKPGARWVEIPSSYYAGIKSGTHKGVTLEGDSTYGTYGYANRPTLQITYTK